MSGALAADARLVTADELALIKTTVAAGATDAELKLFLFDCARQGVHPLDKLIHFTKRGGKYTPITSIDFMRIRAADSGEMAGSDDPEFEFGDVKDPDLPTSATVTVYRLTQGQRFAYTATARWSEYKPEQNDFMWRKMPHTMLGKCAEALALRKGFPRQLAGLYAKEELDQADAPKGYVVEAPVPGRGNSLTSESLPTTAGPSVPNGGDSGHRMTPGRIGGEAAAIQGESPAPAPVDDNGPELVPDDVELPEGYVLIRRVDVTDTRNKNVKKACVLVSTGETFSTINPKLAALCEQLAQNGTPVRVESKSSRYGADLVAVHTVPAPVAGQALAADDMPF